MVIADLGRKVEGELLGWRVAVGAVEAQLDVFVGVVKEVATVHVVAQEHGGRRLAEVIAFLRLQRELVRQFPLLVLVAQHAVDLHLVGGHLGRVSVRLLPVAIRAVVAVAAHVVAVAHHGDVRVGGEAHGKHACLMVVIGAVTHRGVAHPRGGVLLLQSHVEHQGQLVFAQRPQVGGDHQSLIHLAVHLDFVDHVVG